MSSLGPARSRTAVLPTIGLAASLLCLTACTAATGGTDPSGLGGSPADMPTGSAAPAVAPVRLMTSPRPRARGVRLETPVRVAAVGGSLRSVRVASSEGPLAGKFAADHATWRSTGRLQPGIRYTVRSVAEDAAGKVQRSASTFQTVDLPLTQQTYPSLAPLAGETVGVGMPVVVSFDIPVTDRASIERHMKVTSTPAQRGSWHWLSDSLVHWRPDRYWQPGSEVTVDLDIDSVPAGNGVYGQLSRQVTFHVGDAHIYRVNARTHQMQVFSNGQLLRTLPITTGKPGFTTRSGIKVIMEKYRTKRMNSETVGIANNSAEGYDIDDVEYAMRVTNSGEFIHAAPWSVGSQGRANVSHGCTGLSTELAGWLYAMTVRGDVVEYTGTDRQMTLDNGYGDWNVTPKVYREGSAL